LRTRAVAVVEAAAAHPQGMEIGWTQTIDRLQVLVERGF